MKAFQIATTMRVRCDCDARANPRNKHCIIYESVSNCDCAAIKIAAHAHRSRNWKLSLRVPDTLKVTAGECYINEKQQILMAKTHGFHKVVRAGAVTR
jgi:hypothetical protein